MSNGDIELDDLEIVEVSGKAYNDTKKNDSRKKGRCHLSLRNTTLLIFFGLLVLYVVGIVIQNAVMKVSFEDLEMSECKRSVNRVSISISTDMVSLRELAQQYAFWNEAVNLTKYPEENLELFVEDNFMNDDSINADLKLNFIGFVDLEFNTWYSLYYPPPPDNSAQVGEEEAEVVPEIKPEIIRQAAEKREDETEGFSLIIIPDKAKDLFFIAIEPIMDSVNESDESVYGYLMMGRNVAPRVQSFSNDVPTCISIECQTGSENWDEEDIKAFEESTPGSFNDDDTYAGEPAYRIRPFEFFDQAKNRFCPEEGVNATPNIMAGYFSLCDFEPEDGNYSTCVRIRLDNPMSLMAQGNRPVGILSASIIVLMVVLCIIFVIFLDCVVLRPIVNLSKVLEKQAQWQDDEDAELNYRRRKGKSAHGSNDHSQGTSNSDESGSGANDEIGKLRRAMEQNATGLKRRLKAVDKELKNEQLKTARHRQAMQLLNLWRGHKNFFPGLRPNAMELRYEPPRKLDDLLSSPLAIEFLKSHCESDRSLENLWFLLDVSWVEELEKAREHEENAEKRKQIHEVAIAASNAVIDRYVGAGAAQPINISSATSKRLREKQGTYERGMFSAAVSEVKMLITTDILPRFQKSPAYVAMSEALFSIAPAGTESDVSEFSDESGSTAGSILTDDGDEDAGVARVYAQTFKTLHTNFAATSDASMLSLHQYDGNQAINGVLHLEPRTKKNDRAENKHPEMARRSSVVSPSESSKSSEDSSVDESSDEDEKSSEEGSEKDTAKEEEPKKEESEKEETKNEEPEKEEPEKEETKNEEPEKEEPKKEEPKKEEGKEAESSESSSSALSEDSVTMSSASSDESEE